MSSSPNNDLLSDAAVAAPIGAAAMLARGLLSTTRLSWGWVARSSAAAGIVSVMANMALKDYISSENIRIVCVGLCGFGAPEIIDWGINNSPRLVEKLMSVFGLSSNAKSGKKRRKRS